MSFKTEGRNEVRSLVVQEGRYGTSQFEHLKIRSQDQGIQQAFV